MKLYLATALAITGSSVILHGQSNLDLLNRVEQDLATDRQATIQDWVNPGEVQQKQMDACVEWFLRVTPQFKFDDNAFRSEFSEEDSWRFDYSAETGIIVKTDNAGSLKFSAAGGGAHFFDYDDKLSGNSLTGTIVYEPDVGDFPIVPSLNFVADWQFEEGFGDEVQNTQTPALRLGYKKFFFEKEKEGRPEAGELIWSNIQTTSYQFADPKVSEAFGVAFSTKVTYMVTERLGAVAQTSLTYRDYQNITRDQWVIRAGVALDYSLNITEQASPLKKLNAKVGLDFANSDDSIIGKDYDQFVFFTSLSASF